MQTAMTSWMESAACRSRQAARLPWTADAPTLPRATVAAMQAVCAGCPVAPDCARYVERAEIAGGFWAGADRDALAHAPEQLDLLDTLDVLGGAA